MVKSWLIKLVSLSFIFIVFFMSHGPMVMSSALTNLGFVKYIQAISQTIKKQELIRSENLLRKAIDIQPTNVRAFRGVGLNLVFQGKEEKSIIFLQDIPEMPKEVLARAKKALQAKKYAKALMWCEIAKTLAPGLGDTYYYKGKIYELNGLWKASLNSYRAATRTVNLEDIGRSNIYYRLGVIYHKKLSVSQLDKALNYYDLAINLDSFTSDYAIADTHYKRGEIYALQERDYRYVIREYDQAVKFYSKHYWAHLKLGYSLYNAYGDISLAEQKVNKALELWPNNKSRKWPYRVLGNIYRDAGLVEKAIVSYSQALRIDPDDAQVPGILVELGNE